MHVDTVVAHLGDRFHEWHNLSMLDRVEWYDLCPAGLCNSPYLSGARRVWDLIALAGLIEQMGGLPGAGGWLDQPHATVQAFSVIRGTRNRIQERNVAAARENAKR